MTKSYDVPRPLKILRSVPSVLADSPNQEGYNQQLIHSYSPGQNNGNSADVSSYSSFRSDHNSRNKYQRSDNNQFTGRRSGSEQFSYPNIAPQPRIQDTKRISNYSDYGNVSSENTYLPLSNTTGQGFSISQNTGTQPWSRRSTTNYASTNYPGISDNKMNNDHTNQWLENDDRMRKRKWRKKWRQLQRSSFRTPQNLKPHPLPINPYSD